MKKQTIAAKYVEEFFFYGADDWAQIEDDARSMSSVDGNVLTFSDGSKLRIEGSTVAVIA